MKKLSFFGSLFLLTLSLFTQNGASQCSTIVLENDMEIPAYISYINSGFLFYQSCPDSTSQRYTIPVDIIKFIREPNGAMHSLSTHMAKLPNIESIKDKDQPLNKLNNWVFKEKTRNKVIVIMQEQYLKVVYKDASNKLRKENGKWEMLTETELILSRRKKSSLTIPKKDIVKIVVFKKNRGIGKVIGIVLWAIGGVVSLIIILEALKEADQQNTSKPILGSLLGVLFLAIIITGITSIIFAINSKSIKYPFNGDWEITYPSTGKNDVKEFYKQP